MSPGQNCGLCVRSHFNIPFFENTSIGKQDRPRILGESENSVSLVTIKSFFFSWLYIMIAEFQTNKQTMNETELISWHEIFQQKFTSLQNVVLIWNGKPKNRQKNDWVTEDRSKVWANKRVDLLNLKNIDQFLVKKVSASECLASIGEEFATLDNTKSISTHLDSIDNCRLFIFLHYTLTPDTPKQILTCPTC